jgi:hypothetical protein
MPAAKMQYNNWTVVGWSIQYGLLTLTLGKFFVEATDNSWQNTTEAMRAKCFFSRPSRVRFNHFLPGPEAIIQNIEIMHESENSTIYRFSFGAESLVEIVAQAHSTIEW